MKTIQVIIIIFINVLTYKEMHAKQKALNKLQQCNNDYQMDKKILQEKIVQPKIESYSYLKWTKKCDFSHSIFPWSLHSAIFGLIVYFLGPIMHIR